MSEDNDDKRSAGAGAAQFATTRWSLVLSAGHRGLRRRDLHPYARSSLLHPVAERSSVLSLPTHAVDHGFRFLKGSEDVESHTLWSDGESERCGGRGFVGGLEQVRVASDELLGTSE